MTFEEQLALVRMLYNKCRERYYQKEFRWLLMALLAKKPEYYKERCEYIYVLMSVAENALLRGEIDRGLRYVACFQGAIGSLENRMKADSKKYWKDLSVG